MERTNVKEITTLNIIGLVRVLNRIYARTPSDASVLQAVVTHRGVTGKIHPSVETLSAETNYSKSQVKRALKHWKDIGILTVLHKGCPGRDGSSGKANDYGFDHELAKWMVTPVASAPPTERGLMDNEKRAHETQKRAHDDTEEGSSVSPKELLRRALHKSFTEELLEAETKETKPVNLESINPESNGQSTGSGTECPIPPVPLHPPSPSEELDAARLEVDNLVFDLWMATSKNTGMQAYYAAELREAQQRLDRLTSRAA